MSPRTLGLLMASTTALCWAVLAIALKFSLTFASPGNVIWVRMAVAAILLTGIFSIYRPAQLTILKFRPKLAIFAGILLAGNYLGFMKGVELTSAANAQIMIQLAPMSLLVIGIFYFKESLSRWQWSGVALATSGFGFFYWDQILMAVGNTTKFIQGDLWILFAVITWALFATFQKILSQRWTPQQINLVIYIVAAFALAPLLDWASLTQLKLWQWLFLVVLGVNTIVAYGALGEALKRIPASHVSLIISLNPLLTLVLLKVIEHFEWTFIAPEPVLWRGYLGACLVVTGVGIAVALKPSSKPLAQATPKS